jgi:DNA-binding LacI/PurR family transcriptional regulator
MGRVTLQTIADRVGVSRTTVSNAFSRPDQLSDELRDRIRGVAAELGYAGPDPLARGLRSGRVGAIGVLLTESLGYTFRDPYNTRFLVGVAEATGAADTGMLLVPLPPGRRPGDAIRNAVVDGVVVFTLPDAHPAIDLVRARRLPMVTVDGPHLEGVPFISIDERAAAGALTRMVCARGHRRLLVLAFRVADDDRTGVVDDERLAAARYEVTRARLAGVLTGARDAGVRRDAVTIVEVGANDPALVRPVTMEALRSSAPPTAILAMSDQIALSAIDAVRECGLRVPEDVSVTGYDDVNGAAAAGLTTVRQSADAKGRRAAELLTDHGGPVGDVVVPHEIITRDTLAPPPPRR